MANYRIEIRWGLIFTLVFLLWMGFEKAMGWHGPNIEDHPIYTNLFMIPVLVLYFLAIREKREKGLGGVMDWKQGFFSGVVLTAVAVLLSPLSQWIFHTMISPEYLPNVREYAVTNDRMSFEEARDHFTVRNYIVMSTVGAAVSGVLLSAIMALFLRRKQGGSSLR